MIGGKLFVKKFFFLFFIVLPFNLFAQEPLMPLVSVQDSAMLAAERQLMYYQFLSGILPSGEWMQSVQLPDFDFKSEMVNRWSYDFSAVSTNPLSFNDFMPGYFGLGTDPFLRDVSVFSGAAYRLNDRFTFGGYSFGANSVFSAPFPNQGMNNFDVRGSTMFLKYNVSKNFKIETRVNVIQGPGN
jgi:hypothetical protein